MFRINLQVARRLFIGAMLVGVPLLLSADILAQSSCSKRLCKEDREWSDCAGAQTDWCLNFSDRYAIEDCYHILNQGPSRTSDGNRLMKECGGGGLCTGVCGFYQMGLCDLQDCTGPSTVPGFKCTTGS